VNSVNFFSEQTDFSLTKPSPTKDWVLMIISREAFQSGNINFIFTNDEHLHEINMKYLNHNTFTDIITFDTSEEESEIAGDIFISVERVRDNAKTLRTSFDEEIHRVIIHGVLHLMGYSDSTKEEKEAMRKKEEACLSLRN